MHQFLQLILSTPCRGMLGKPAPQQKLMLLRAEVGKS